MSNKSPAPVKPPVAGEFQRFLTKSNAIALAIGVVIGGATTNLVNAVVSTIITPIVNTLLGGASFGEAQIVLSTTKGADGQVVVNAIRYGDLFTAIINFLVIMLVVFVLAKIFAPSVLAEDAK